MPRRYLRLVPVTAYAALAGFFAWAFWERYWRNRDCFNDLGRCYDAQTREVITSGSAFWGVLAVVFTLIFVVTVLRRDKST